MVKSIAKTSQVSSIYQHVLSIACFRPESGQNVHKLVPFYAKIIVYTSVVGKPS